jgi:hypothetical protein
MLQNNPKNPVQGTRVASWHSIENLDLCFNKHSTAKPKAPMHAVALRLAPTPGSCVVAPKPLACLSALGLSLVSKSRSASAAAASGNM